MGEWMWRLQDFKLSVRVKRSVYHAVEGARAEDMRDCSMMHIPPWYLYTSCGVGETRAGMPAAISTTFPQYPQHSQCPKYRLTYTHTHTHAFLDILNIRPTNP